MTPADLALNSAIHFEGVKHAYRQTKDGVVISFVVHPHDVPKGLAEAPLGSRYIVALVQVGDDEQPVPAKESSATPEVVQDKPPPPAKRREWTEANRREWRKLPGRMDWRDLQPAAQAGIRCDDPVFWKFLEEECAYAPVSSEDAAEAVREICAVRSRSELGTNHKARVLWHQLDEQFQAWKLIDA